MTLVTAKNVNYSICARVREWDLVYIFRSRIVVFRLFMQEKMNRKCISARSFYAILNDGTISSKK